MGVPEKVQRMREKSGTGRNLSSVNFFPAVLLNLVTRSPDAGIGAEKLGTDSYRDKRCPKRVRDVREKKNLARNCYMVRSRSKIESGWKRAAKIRLPEYTSYIFCEFKWDVNGIIHLKSFDFPP